MATMQNLTRLQMPSEVPSCTFPSRWRTRCPPKRLFHLQSTLFAPLVALALENEGLFSMMTQSLAPEQVFT